MREYLLNKYINWIKYPLNGSIAIALGAVKSSFPMISRFIVPSKSLDIMRWEKSFLFCSTQYSLSFRKSTAMSFTWSESNSWMTSGREESEKLTRWNVQNRIETSNVWILNPFSHEQFSFTQKLTKEHYCSRKYSFLNRNELDIY